MNRMRVSELLDKYDLGNLAIETWDAHSALSILREALNPTLYLRNMQPQRVHGKNWFGNRESIELLKNSRILHIEPGQ